MFTYDWRDVALLILAVITAVGFVALWAIEAALKWWRR